MFNGTNRNNIVKGGVAAGAFGGIALWVALLLDRADGTGDAFSVLKTAGAPFLGERALKPGPDWGAVAVGIVSHLAVSVVWGLIFAALFYGLSKVGTLVAGTLWGIVVWLGMFYVVLPLVGWWSIAQGMPPLRAVMFHLLFGLALGIGMLPFQHPRVRVEVRRSGLSS